MERLKDRTGVWVGVWWLEWRQRQQFSGRCPKYLTYLEEGDPASRK
jgi:hypothetical protein